MECVSVGTVVSETEGIEPYGKNQIVFKQSGIFYYFSCFKGVAQLGAGQSLYQDAL